MNKKTASVFRQGGYSFVGAAGFEPAISWSQTRRLNRAGPRPDRLKRSQIYAHSFYRKVLWWEKFFEIIDLELGVLTNKRKRDGFALLMPLPFIHSLSYTNCL